jgi:pyruvate carboxylase
MSEYLFVYGSLKRGFGGQEATEISQQLNWIGQAEVYGKLYDLGRYCAAILDRTEDSVIKGELLEIPDASMLKQLDEYEEYDALAPYRGLFVRQKAQTLINGRIVEAWIYTYNRDPGDAPVIASGEYTIKRI